MREYITTKGFYSGDLDKYVLEKEQIKFDGLRAIFRGEEHKAPQLAAAIKVGWLIPVTTDAKGKLVADVAPENQETAEQRAKRLRAERLQKINGSAGSGEFLEEHHAKLAQAKKVKPVEAKAEPEKKKVRELVEADGTALTHPDIKKKAEAPAPEPKKVRELINEQDGDEVKKINVAAHASEEESDPGSFYEALQSGEKKSLSVTRDQYVPKPSDEDPFKAKAKVVATSDDNSDLQAALNAQDGVGKHPVKGWSSMSATKKQAYIKKATDNALLKQIIASEKGVVKRKAQERLSEIDSNHEREGL